MLKNKYVKMLNKIAGKDFSLTGGKGSNLGEMIRAGLPVPGGFVVLTTAYNDYIEFNNFQVEIEKILKDLKPHEINKIETASQQIRNKINEARIPDKIVEEINDIYESLGGVSVAVRSSSTAEDLPGTSFAGQYSTFLNIKGIDGVIDAVRRCWASLWTSRAVSYRLKQGISHEKMGHAVVVQKLINSEKAGILFTANPVNGRRDQMMINASWGLGEAIVSGEVSPDQWVVDKNSVEIIERNIARKNMMTYREQQGTISREIPVELREKETLNNEEVKNLIQIGQKTEDYFGSPQDIEWAYEDGKFYLVQTRPITSLFPLPKSESEKKEGFRVNISFNLWAQTMPEPFTPMGEEMFRLVFAGYVGLATGNKEAKYPWWFKIAAGRIYLDITELLRKEKNWDNIADKIVDKDPITAKALVQVLEDNKEKVIKENKGFKIPGHLKLLFIKMGVYIVYAMLSPAKASKKIKRLGLELVEHLEDEARHLKSVEEKLKFIDRGIVDITVTSYKQVFGVAFGFKALEKAEELLEKWLGEEVDLNILRKSLPNNPTTKMGMDLVKVARKFEIKGEEPELDSPEIKKFLEKYGDRSTIEIDVGIPRWYEEPSYVLELINSYLENENSEERIKKFYYDMEQAEEKINEIVQQVRERKSFIHSKLIKYLLRSYRKLAGLREQPKFDLVKALSLFRRLLKEVGEKLVAEGRVEKPEDVFYVRFKDIRSDKNLREVAANNRIEYQREFERKSIPRIITSTGESIYSVTKEESENTLAGVPVSPGVYEGQVKIIHEPQGADLKSGEILVTRGTNPAWTPLFINAGGLIMETGGPVSHGSIVAREYGIPAVVGVREAASRLENGQMVRINGESGQVILID